MNNNQPGKYLIRRADDTFVPAGFENGSVDTKTTNPSTYQGIVNLPTTYGTMLIRLLVRHNTTEELNTLHTYQNASHLAPVHRKAVNAPATPKLTSQASNG